MPTPINASRPVSQSSFQQVARRTALIEVSAGCYSFEHAGHTYNVKLNPAPEGKLDAQTHRRIRTVLRIFTDQVTADLGKAPNHMRFSPNGYQVNGRPYTPSDAKRVRHYFKMMSQLLGKASDLVVNRHAKKA